MYKVHILHAIMAYFQLLRKTILHNFYLKQPEKSISVYIVIGCGQITVVICPCEETSD